MNKIKVSKKNNRFSVVALKNISKGEYILKLQGTISSVPDKYSIQIDAQKHLYPFSEDPQDESSFFRFLNHSCMSNSYFDIPNMALIALKNILPGEDVTFHYCTTEHEMAFPFQCLCGTVNCLKEIKGFRYLSAEIKKELFSQLAPHLKTAEDPNL